MKQQVRSRGKTGCALYGSGVALLLFALDVLLVRFAGTTLFFFPLCAAALIFLLVSAIWAFRASGAGGFLVGALCAAMALASVLLCNSLFRLLLLPPMAALYSLQLAAVFFFCGAVSCLAAGAGASLQVSRSQGLARLRWPLHIFSLLSALSAAAETALVLTTPPGVSGSAMFGTSSAVLAPLIQLLNLLWRGVETGTLSRAMLPLLALAAAVYCFCAGRRLRAVREIDERKIQEMRDRLL